MTKVAVLVPWAGECPHRAAAFAYVRSWYGRHFPDWEIHTGTSRPGPLWCKAEALRDAVSKTSADILVVADADCYAPKISEAVQAVREGFAWGIPHYTVHRLNLASTKMVIEDGRDPAGFPRNVHHYAQMPYTGYAGGGIAVITRDAYMNCPMDPGFVGWGQEDESWALGLRSLYGVPWRPQSGPLWHLWHPPQLRMSRAVGSAASGELRTAYRKAARAGSMDLLLERPRQYVRSGGSSPDQG